MTKAKILFVDDEANVLQGLKRMLWKMRGDWTMAFAQNGAKALEMMRHTQADVVVSDMRMPGMNGAELLAEIRKRYPSAVRIILSGYSDQEAVLRTTGPAHQYLAKPCDSEILTNTIARSLELRSLLRSEKLRCLVSGLDMLPTPPSILAELEAEMSAPESSAGRVAGIISQDIAMTTQILKLTNSAFFSISHEITKPLQAVQLLGLDTIHALVATAGFFSLFKGDAKSAALMERLSQNSLAIGAAVHAIAKQEGFDAKTAAQARCAGWVCHVGALLLMANWPDKFATSLSMAQSQDVCLAEAQRQIFGGCHCEAGAYLLGLWGFNEPVVQAIAYYLEPAHHPAREISITTCLHVAQNLILADEQMPALRGTPLDMQYLTETGAADRLDSWGAICSDVLATGAAA